MKYLFVVFLICIALLIYATRTVNNSHFSVLPKSALNSFQIYNLINDYRAKNNLPKLSWNPKICDYAKTRLNQIHSDWSHNGYWNTPPFYVKVAYTGENLANSTLSESQTLKDWINSPEHKANIENPHFTQTCIASDVYQNVNYSVQEFASDF
jgi:uncharacterized protein YkwD